MSATEDLRRALDRISALERQIAGMMRMGRVKKSEKGRVQVEYRKADVGDSDRLESPYVRTAHGGAQTESRQWTEGETVMVLNFGGNPEHAILFPAGFSDNHPHDKDDTDDATTQRFRKKPEQNQQGQGQQGGGSGGGKNGYGDDKNDAPKWKDDDKDLKVKTNYDGHARTKGDASYKITGDEVEAKHGKRVVKVNKDEASLTDGDATVTVKGGKVTIKASSIYLEGDVFLGGEGAADRVATEKTRDGMGRPLMEPFSTKAKAK